MLLVNLTIGALGAQAAEISVAVASNFLSAESELVSQFEAESGHRVLTSSGSTGKLFAQITQGAPFDILLAADSVRPRKLIELGLAPPQSYFIYATGRLALWSPTAASADDAKAQLTKSRYKHLAIANPKTAPYGMAAVEAMRALGLSTDGDLVNGENIAQTFQFVHTGHAELGFVAQSQLMRRPLDGAFWPVPKELHRPIEQAAVLIGRTETSEAATEFLAFLKSSRAREIITSYGYAAD